MPNQKHTNMKTAWLAGFLFLSNQCVSDQRTQDVPGQLHESLKASSPNEKPFSPTVVKPHARKLAKASRRSCERPGKNERTFEQPPYIYIYMCVCVCLYAVYALEETHMEPESFWVEEQWFSKGLYFQVPCECSRVCICNVI